MQAGKHISTYYSNDEPVDWLYATGWPVHSIGRHWSFLDARPKMASGYRLQSNMRPVDAVSRPVDTANFFLQNQNGHLLPVDALPQPFETAQVLWKKNIVGWPYS